MSDQIEPLSDDLVSWIYSKSTGKPLPEAQREDITRAISLAFHHGRKAARKSAMKDSEELS